ncbi:aldehyde dehydrogenase [Candidatus Daviesbacteria bacterium]|nr:aldehyde dehydrogenase [Candidatus Daviesbacteria bacterium]
MKTTSKKTILRLSKELAKRIAEKKEALTTLLLDYESFETAKDELFRSKDALDNIENEIDYLTKSKVDVMCTFFPVNLPLYSLVIFALIPSFMSEKVFIRPPRLMAKAVKDIMAILEVEKLFPNVNIVEMERGLFRDAYVSVADVVLFTGKYENAIELQSVCPKALFIYNGAGVNPVVITESADLELAVKKTVEMRTFNSGQDCAGSDAILVHRNVAKKFVDLLKIHLKGINVGDYHDRENTVGRIVKQDKLSELEKFFQTQKEYLVYGGEIDREKGIVFPTIFVEDMKEVSSIYFTEFFAPVFYVLIYDNGDDLKKYFLDQYYQDYAMYISLFGQSSFIQSISSSVILSDKIVNDVERGYYPYGGYGDKANFIIYQGKKISRPILISREIAERQNI